MRGRTNITPRTGPAVIGTDVTNKQVTGSAITVGDFVEFTGNTAAFEVIDGPDVFGYSDYVELDSATCIYVRWSASQQFKFVVWKNGEIVNEQTISSIPSVVDSSFGYDTRCHFRVTYRQGQIFVGLAVLPRDAFTYDSLFIFDFDSITNEIEYNSSLGFPNAITDAKTAEGSTSGTYNNVAYAPFVNGNYYFIPVLFSYNSANRQYAYIVVYDSQLNFVKIAKSTNMASSDTLIYATIYNVEGYVFIGYNSTASTSKITFINTSTLDVFQQSISNSDRIFAFGSEIKYNDGLYFVAYNKYTGSKYGFYCGVFYIFDDTVSVITFGEVEQYSGSNQALIARINVSKTGDIYNIIVVNDSGFSSWKLRISYLRYSNSSLQLVNYIESTDTTSQSQTMKYIDIVHYKVLFSRSDGNTSQIFNLYKYSFAMSGGEIVPVNPLDLVKKYQSRIDGVAKTSGNVGQTITVCIP